MLNKQYLLSLWSLVSGWERNDAGLHTVVDTVLMNLKHLMHVIFSKVRKKEKERRKGKKEGRRERG